MLELPPPALSFFEPVMRVLCLQMGGGGGGLQAPRPPRFSSRDRPRPLSDSLKTPISPKPENALDAKP